MKLLFLILIGGILGTLCRYGIMQLPWSSKFVYGTLAVNLIGAFLSGFFYVLLKSYFQEYSQYFPALFIGFFGALTTFSTFMLDTVKYMEAKQCGMAVLNIAVQNILGLLCIWGGMLIGKRCG